MADPKKLADVAKAPAPWTSALGPWALIRRAVGIPARNPAAAAAEEAALVEMRAAFELEDRAAPALQNTPVSSEEIRRRMLAVGAPPERVADWAKPRGAPADRLVAEWLAELDAGERPHLLILTGSAGAGKTVAALDALAWALREKSRGPARYENAEALLNLGRWGEDGPKWDRATEAGTLVLDELKAVERGYRFERLEALLCRRYDSGRPTAITSNLTPQVIRDKRGPFGERVASRLGDERACRIVECGTVDLRRQKP